MVDGQQVTAGREERAGQFEAAERAARWTVGKACEDTVPECTKYMKFKTQLIRDSTLLHNEQSLLHLLHVEQGMSVARVVKEIDANSNCSNSLL